MRELRFFIESEIISPALVISFVCKFPMSVFTPFEIFSVLLIFLNSLLRLSYSLCLRLSDSSSFA